MATDCLAAVYKVFKVSRLQLLVYMARFCGQGLRHGEEGLMYHAIAPLISSEEEEERKSKLLLQELLDDVEGLGISLKK